MVDGDPGATNYYDRLDVSETDTIEQIEQQARRVVAEYHPDRNPDSSSTEFDRINKARKILTNEQKRAQYDSYATDLSLMIESKACYIGKDLKVRVTRSDGSGVHNAIVEAGSERYTTDGNGVATIQFEKPGEKIITVDKHDHDTIRYTAGQVECTVEDPHDKVEIELDRQEILPGQAVRVSLTNKIGDPIPGSEIKVLNKQGDEKIVETNHNGVYKLLIETPGTYHISYQESGEMKDGCLLEVSEKSGAQIQISDDPIVVDEPFELTIVDESQRPISNVYVELCDRHNTIETKRTRRDGTVIFTPQSPGEHEVIMRDPQYEETSSQFHVSKTMGVEPKEQVSTHDQTRTITDANTIWRFFGRSKKIVRAGVNKRGSTISTLSGVGAAFYNHYRYTMILAIIVVVVVVLYIS